MCHGDDDGLVLPPAIAPIQVAVIPVAQHKEGVLETVGELANKLKEKFRVKFDDSDNSPGWKFSQYEMKGVPVRLEMGPKDIEKNQCVLVRRDTREKIFVSLDNVEQEIEKLLKELEVAMFNRALENRQAKTETLATMEEIIASANEKDGFINALWCGDAACEEKMKDDAGLSSRCMPFE